MSTSRQGNPSAAWPEAAALVVALLAFVACDEGRGPGDGDGDADADDGGPLDGGDQDGSGDAGGDSDADGDGESDAGGTERYLCVQTCTTGSGCLPPSVCDGRRCVMTESEHACSVDHDCIPFESFWDIGTACTAGGSSCSSIEACVDVGGSGYCVRKPTAPDTCTGRGLVEVEWPGIDGEPVTVCGRTSGICDRDLCVSGCARDGDCTTSSRPVCDVAARRCVCSPSSCGSSNAGALCLASGQCGCALDADCPGPGFDRCYGDQCGCSDAASCNEMLEGYSLVCEPLPE